MNKSFFILITLGLLASCQSLTNSTEKPKIQLEKDTLQLGLVSVGDSVSIRLTVKNIGGETLNITNIGYECGCTKGKIEKNTLGVSETTSFEFTYKNEIDIDDIDKTIIFETNAKEPFKLLKIIGHGASKINVK